MNKTFRHCPICNEKLSECVRDRDEMVFRCPSAYCIKHVAFDFDKNLIAYCIAISDFYIIEASENTLHFEPYTPGKTVIFTLELDQMISNLDLIPISYNDFDNDILQLIKTISSVLSYI